jgi:hypothetical protein
VHSLRRSTETASAEALVDALTPLAALMLQGELSAAMLVQAVKLAYLRAAVSALEEKSMRASTSRLSVITGMTRKEVAALMKVGTKLTESAGPRRMLEHRAVRVLRGWRTDPLYRNSYGRPADLPLDGDGRTFSALVRAHGGDVTPISVLRELERISAITRTRKGELRPRARARSFDAGSNSRLRDFSRLVMGFSSAAAESLSKSEAPAFVAFKEIAATSEIQAERFKESFGRRAALLLDSVQHWDARHTRKKRSSSSGSREAKHQVGLGVYVVHTAPRLARATKVKAKRGR